MATSRHKDHLNQYLRKHKEHVHESSGQNQSRALPGNSNQSIRHNDRKTGDKAKRSNTDKVSSRSNDPANTKSLTSDVKATSRTTVKQRLKGDVSTKPKRKTTMDSLPDEILFHIMGYLGANDLLVCACVCKRWTALTNDNVIWQKIYRRVASKIKIKGQENDVNFPQEASHWKSLCIKRCVDHRNSRVFPALKTIHRFTGVPAATARVLESAGVRWQVCLTNRHDKIHTTYHNDVTFFSMSVNVRWFSLEFPSLKDIRRLQIFSINPVFFNEKGKPEVNSPYQRSRMIDIDFHWSRMMNKCSLEGEDDVIKLYKLPDNVTIALWKDSEELAFITTGFHYHLLVHKCLLGTASSIYQVPSRIPRIDDIDPQYGLHGYKCTVEIRNQKASFWSRQFPHLECRHNEYAQGFAVFHCIQSDCHWDRSSIGKEVKFLWKTELFKGIIENVCIVDVTMIDEEDEPFICISTPIRITDFADAEVSYDYDGNSHTFTYSDETAKLIGQTYWDAERETHFLTSLQLHVSLKHINSWFATKY